MRKLKSIDVQAKEWFDKSGGNSYFSAKIHVTHEGGLTGTIEVPFQYGYEEQYVHTALEALKESGYIPATYDGALWRYCRENDIELTTRKLENCKKSDVKAFTL